MLRAWSRSQHCQCLQEGRSPSPGASALGQSPPVTPLAGSSRPQARLPELLSKHKHPPLWGPARFSVSVSGNKAALTITGAQPRARPSLLCSVRVSYNAAVVHPHGEALPKPCAQGLASSQEGRGGGKALARGGGGSGLPSPSTVHGPRLLLCLPWGAPALHWGPLSAHNDVEGIRLFFQHC